MSNETRETEKDERFEMQQHADGQIYITEDGESRLHAQIRGSHDVEIQIGAEGKVEVDKLYGPLVMWPLRISIDFENAQWVIEREFGLETHRSGVECPAAWLEVARISGQLVSDFSDVDSTSVSSEKENGFGDQALGGHAA